MDSIHHIMQDRADRAARPISRVVVDQIKKLFVHPESEENHSVGYQPSSKADLKSRTSEDLRLEFLGYTY